MNNTKTAGITGRKKILFALSICLASAITGTTTLSMIGPLSFDELKGDEPPSGSFFTVVDHVIDWWIEDRTITRGSGTSSPQRGIILRVFISFVLYHAPVYSTASALQIIDECFLPTMKNTVLLNLRI